MARTSPGTRIAVFLFLVIFSFSCFAQNANGSAAAQAQVGPLVQLEGQLHIQYQDFKDRSTVSYTLKLSNGKTVPLRFTKNPPTRFLSGDHVQVNGQMSGSNLVLYSGSTNVSTSSKTGSGGSTTPIPLPNTFGPQSTLVILVNFQDAAIQPYTVADAQNLFSGTINDFFVENSYGQTTIVPTVVGWYTIPESVTTCNAGQIATDAQNAATAAGVVLSNYARYVYMFPYDTACGFAGMSDVGGKPSQSWINGTTGTGNTSLDPHVIDHELGHAFGLWHAHLLNCGSSATICSNGTVIEYGDPMDVMGTPQGASPDYNAFQKERLGWLNYGTSPSIQTVTASGTYTIAPYESGAGPKGLKILQSVDSTTGAKTWYYLEARQAVGFDAFLSTSTYYMQNETTGVLFHLGTDGNGNSSDMLDMTPDTQPDNSWFDMSLPVGQTFADANAGVTITPTAVSSAGATVQVSINGSSPCTQGSPSVTVSPSQSQSVAPGTAVSFAASVRDTDSSGCSPTTFSLGDIVPSGWTGVWNTSSLSLSPGKSGSATLTVTSPSGTVGGLYTVAVNANNASAGSYSGSATGTYVVATSGPLAVSVSTSQSSYLPGQTVSITVTVVSGTSPAVGVGVTATVSSPSGKLTTIRGTTGSSGTALLNYKLSRGATAGTYQVGATATSSTSTVSTANATAVANSSFTVQ